MKKGMLTPPKRGVLSAQEALADRSRCLETQLRVSKGFSPSSSLSFSCEMVTVECPVPRSVINLTLNRELTRKFVSVLSQEIPFKFEGSDAVFSPCRKYRYALWRTWDARQQLVLFIGLNPSTADEVKNDPTIRRCIGFAGDWGYGGVLIGNLFAYRATRPEDMKQGSEPVGSENDLWIERMVQEADQVVAAWGNHGAYLNRFNEVRELIPQMKCLGLTAQNHPRHPLYLRKDVKRMNYNLSTIVSVSL